eukprot:g17268.t2
MGSAVGTPSREEMNGYRAVKEAYESLSPQQRQEAEHLRQLSNLFEEVSLGRASPLLHNEIPSTGKGGGEGSHVAELLRLSADEKLELGQAVLRAVLQREEALRAAIGKSGDYTKSFSGTKQDTQVENEFASLVRGDVAESEAVTTVPILQPVECSDPEELAKLRSAGKWFRYLGANCCYLWINTLTREVTPLRPTDYVEEEAPAEAEEEKDAAGGYPTCPLSGLPSMISTIIDDQKRTPLLIDNSEDDKVTAFLSYKAVLVDVSILAIGYQKSGTKVCDLMESVRTKAVAAMKSGTLLALRLGRLTSEHANFKSKLCARDVFPAEMFQEGGKKMFLPGKKPREWRGGMELVWLEVFDLGRSMPVSRFDLFQIGPSEISPREVEPSMSLETFDSGSEMLQRLHSVIQSRDYGPFDTPEVQTVEWSSADGESLVLTFSASTNRPRLDHAKLLVGAETWGGDDSDTSSDPPVGQLRGDLTIRMAFPGHFTAYLFVGERLESTSAQVIDVQLCPNEVVMIAPKRSPPLSSEVPRSVFGADGVLSLPGDKFLKVPSSLFAVQRKPPGGGFRSEAQGSWSIAFWIYLVDLPTGSFRGLFYKGDGGEMGRTPSAWLCPDSNRIALRVTSETNPDIGANSIASLGVNTWNHVAFSFTNNTNGSFSANIYINGTLDISVDFNEQHVLSNTGPLHIGRDPSNKGPRSLVAMIRLWQDTLSPDQIEAVFRASKPLFFGEASDALAARYPSIHAVESMWTREHKKMIGREAGLPAGDREPDASQHELGRAAYEAAMAATAICKSFRERLDMYQHAAAAGHAEARVSYASLLLAGREQLDGEAASSCGREKEAEARAKAVAEWTFGGARVAVEQLELAVEAGSHRGAYALAQLLLTGLGGMAAQGTSSGDCARRYRVSPTLQQLPFAGAVRDQWANTTCEAPTTSRAVALLHFAAVGGHSEAQLALGLRYLEGNGVQLDLETAAFFLACAVEVAHSEYHKVGKQPTLEIQRLTTANEAVVEIGQKGEDDDLIQYQIQRAEQGDLPSIEALGYLYYWGARGLPRDQARALQYFTSASLAGSNNARCAAAGMYLKGEGTHVNHTKAVELYELAAEENHVRALNGLGYVYFTGLVLPQNLTKAYGYFERAANMQEDGDSLFNAAHCLTRGLGTDQDLERGAELYRLAASWGHVDSAYELAHLYAQGTGAERNPTAVAKYLSMVAQVGPWGKRLRLAFDCYLQGDMLSALALYAQVAELGYEVAASNGAFLLDSGKIRLYGGVFQGGDSEPVWSETMAVRLHVLAALKGQMVSFLAIGDAFFYGKAGLPRDSVSACWWFARASSSGIVRGSYNLGFMHEHGLGVPLDYRKALMFYDRASSTVAGVDQNLNGLPIQLLVSIAKARLYLNRATGGRLATLWQRGENEQNQNGTADWLPDLVLLSALSDTLGSIILWITELWNGDRVLNHLDQAQGGNMPSGNMLACLLEQENALLLVLVSLLIVVLAFRRRRR